MSTVTTIEKNSLLASNASMLAEINAAISNILVGGQSYQIGSRKLTRADLGLLYKMRQDFESALAAQDNAGNSLIDDCYVAFWPDER